VKSQLSVFERIAIFGGSMSRIFRVFTIHRDDFYNKELVPQGEFSKNDRLSPRQFELLAEDVLVDSKKYRMLYAPLQADKWLAFDLVFHNELGNKIPDVFCSEFPVVSESVKNIIEAEDDMKHQFWPVRLVDESGWIIEQEPYYRLIIRRLLMFPKKILENKMRFPVDRGEEDYFAALYQDEEIGEDLSCLPIWRCSAVRDVFYVNEKIYKAFVANSLRGLDVYSDYYGFPGEGVVCCG